jgi:hypothetical protein
MHSSHSGLTGRADGGCSVHESLVCAGVRLDADDECEEEQEARAGERRPHDDGEEETGHRRGRRACAWDVRGRWWSRAEPRESERARSASGRVEDVVLSAVEMCASPRWVCPHLTPTLSSKSTTRCCTVDARPSPCARHRRRPCLVGVVPVVGARGGVWQIGPPPRAGVRRRTGTQVGHTHHRRRTPIVEQRRV